jgi:serine protease Do
MKKNFVSYTTFVVVVSLLLSACSLAPLNQELSNKVSDLATNLQANTSLVNTSASGLVENETDSAPITSSIPGSVALADYQNALMSIYDKVNPSVVSIQVLINTSTDLNSTPFQLPDNPYTNPDNQIPSQPSGALGSGFVWDSAGHIITNNHVVKDASKIQVIFSDGTIVDAKVVGTDPDSDLAVLSVDAPSNLLVPVSVANSDDVKVGQLAIAIGNPFGLENTMTVGIVSALDRSLPARESTLTGPSYSIPNIIQTDAPINPGNSGGVLLDADGNLIGVTAAIESTAGSNAGVGFVIPSNIVKQVAPALIDKGQFDHPWLGVSIGSLTPDLAKAMGLDETTRGVLVNEVTANGPAANAGIQGSTESVIIDGISLNVGGDVITAIDGNPVKESGELIAYLTTDTTPGQKIGLTILRDGKEMSVDVTLGTRPSESTSLTPQLQAPEQQQPDEQQQQPSQSKPRLGITGLDLNDTLAQALNLTTSQGVLIIDVTSDSPAALAGLKGGTDTVTIEGQEIKSGGDVIIAIDNQEVTGVLQLRNLLANYVPTATVTLTIIRDGNTMEVNVQLGQ